MTNMKITNAGEAKKVADNVRKIQDKAKGEIELADIMKIITDAAHKGEYSIMYSINTVYACKKLTDTGFYVDNDIRSNEFATHMIEWM